jgi:16S rRNA (guanine527-N7)-methyltransferase
MTLSDVLRVELKGLVEVTEAQLAKLEAHYQLLLRWNQKLNLTTVTKLPEAATRHYGESLFLAKHLSGDRVVDVGSGPGFPGIPSAILREQWHFDLVESHQRKAVFLREATRALGNVDVISRRAEDLQSTYDWLVARAVDPEELTKLAFSSRFALLIGRDDASRLAEQDQNSQWQLIDLPWGKDRVLALVSRETLPPKRFT